MTLQEKAKAAQLKLLNKQREVLAQQSKDGVELNKLQAEIQDLQLQAQIESIENQSTNTI